MKDIEAIKKLRELTLASVKDCQDAVFEASGDFKKALEILKRKGRLHATKKAERDVGPGIIDAYIHQASQVGSMVEIRCETDFVARTEEFRKLAHELCLQIASMAPLWISPEDIPEEILEDEKRRIQEEMTGLGKKGKILEQAMEGKLNDYFVRTCLLRQPYVRNQDETVSDFLTATVAKLGENIKIQNFCRFEI
jgi:elongation factor Ts